MKEEILQAINYVKKHDIAVPPDFCLLRSVSENEGLTVNFFPFGGRIKGIYYYNPGEIEMLTIKKDLTEPHMKNILACILAQRVLKCLPEPAGFIRVLGIPERSFDATEENFAALLLVPPPALEFLAGTISSRGLSKLYNITDPVAQRRVNLYKKYLF